MHAGGVWSTVGYGETGLATVPRSLAADSSSPGATPRPGWENSRRPLRSSPRPRATPVSSGDLSLTAISSNERYHSMMPTLPPPPAPDFTIDSGAGRFRWTHGTGATLLHLPFVFIRPIPFPRLSFAAMSDLLHVFSMISLMLRASFGRWNVKIKLNFSFNIVPDCCEFQWRLVEGNFSFSFLKIIE